MNQPKETSLAKLLNTAWARFIRENMDWLLASLAMAFGIWIIAVLQTDPIEERVFPVAIPIDILIDEDVSVRFPPNDVTADITIRAPSSVWDNLRQSDIAVMADFRGMGEGEQEVDVQIELGDDIRGEVIQVEPNTVSLTLAQLLTQRIPIQTPIVTQAPPSGFTYDPPVCSLTEVTATGPEDRLERLQASISLDLRERRSPATLTVDLIPVDVNGRRVQNVDLEPSQVTCDVTIRQIEGVTELSVVPIVTGFPPSGYIYEGYEFEPTTVTVTGNRVEIQNLNGVVETEDITLAGATSDFERTVSLILPNGVTLFPDSQTVDVTISIGTVPSSRQYASVPIQVEGVNGNLEVDLLPGEVTVFVLGPQPLLRELTSADFRVTVDVSTLEPGEHQLTPEATIIVEALNEDITPDTTITVQPEEVNVTIREVTESDVGN